MKNLYSASKTGALLQGKHDDGNPIKGILLLVFAMQIVPMLDTIAKYLSLSLPLLQIVWARYFFHFILLLPYIFYTQGIKGLFAFKDFMLHVLRGFFLFLSTCFFFAAIKYAPLADSIALVFIYPIIITILAPFILGEKVGIHRWSATVIGFVGVLIIVEPQAGGFNFGTIMAILAGAFYGLYVLFTRKLSGTAPDILMLAFTAFFGAAVTTPVVPFYWSTPDLTQAILMLCIGLIACIGHYLIIRANSLTKAVILAPFGYSEMISALLLGYFIFSDWPKDNMFIGVGILILCGSYIAKREYHNHKNSKRNV